MYLSLFFLFSFFLPSEINQPLASKSDDLVVLLFERERVREREKTRAYSLCFVNELLRQFLLIKQVSVPLKWKIFKRCKSKKYDRSSSSIRPRKQRESNTATNKRRTKTLSSSLVFSFTSLCYFALFFYEFFFVRCSKSFEKRVLRKERSFCASFFQEEQKIRHKEIQKTNVWKEEWSRRKSNNNSNWTQSRTTKRSIKKEEA